jgi:hypothetical protein
MTTLKNTPTLAGAAIAALRAKYTEVPDDGRMKTYLMFCHGCGKIHGIRAEFISGMSASFGFSDGSSIGIGCHKCSDCPSEAIRDAYNNGIKREVWNRAAAEMGATLIPEPKACVLCGAIDHQRFLHNEGAHELCRALAAKGLPTPPLKTKYR